MLSKVDPDEHLVYWQATRGSGQRNHLFPGGPSNLWIMIRPMQISDPAKRIKLITAPDTRYHICNIKTLNLIPNIMALQQAEEAGCQEAVLYRGEMVTECTRSNVHILKNGVFITHPANNLILQGITRNHLLKICERLGIKAEERAFTLAELFDADEVLISSIANFAQAADTIDRKPSGGKAPAILKKLQDELLNEFMEETGKQLIRFPA